MLRCFVGYTQTDWSKYLPGLEFAYNNRVNDTTNFSPFFLEYGQDPFQSATYFIAMKEQKIKTPTKFITDIKEATKLAKRSIEEANTRNADNVKSNRRDDQFELGDELFLSTANLATKTREKQKTVTKVYWTP